MMFYSRRLAVLVMLVGFLGDVCIAQRDGQSSSTSFLFEQPIPVTIRKTNNSIMQAFLVEIDESGITVLTTAQKRFTYPNKTIRRVSNADNSFAYSPEKDNLSDVIERLKQMMPAKNTPGQGSGNTAPGLPHGQGTGTSRPWDLPPATPGPAMPSPTMPAPNMPMPSGAHSGSMPPRMPTPFNPLGPGPQSHGQPMAHGQQPGSMPGMPTMPPTMPTPMPQNQPHAQMPMGSGMPGMPPQMPNPPQMQMPSQMHMQQQFVNVYTCSKCRKTFESATEIQAGAQCPKCGVVWDQVTDQNGRVISTNPAAKIGGGIGLLGLIVWIVIAVVRKAQSD